MGTKTNTTRFPGVYTRESSTRRHDGKPDVVFYYCIKVDGKRVWTRCGWKSEGMTAKEAAHLRSKALSDGKPGRMADLTFAEAWEWYITNQGLSPASILCAQSYARRHILPKFGSRQLGAISQGMLKEWTQELLAGKMGTGTVRHMLVFIGAAYKFTREAGLHNIPSPTKGMTMPARCRPRDRYLTRHEARDLLRWLAEHCPVWHDLAALSLYTGGRLGELVSLTAGQIDMKSRTAKLIGKTGPRFVPLSSAALDVIAPRMEGKKPGAYLFPGKTAGHMAPSSHRFSEAVEALGLNPPGTPASFRVCFHSLRHTFASWLVLEGESLYRVGRLLGHSSPLMTQRYAHLSPEAQQSTVEKIAHVLSLSDDD